MTGAPAHSHSKREATLHRPSGMPSSWGRPDVPKRGLEDYTRDVSKWRLGGLGFGGRFDSQKAMGQGRGRGRANEDGHRHISKRSAAAVVAIAAPVKPHAADESQPNAPFRIALAISKTAAMRVVSRSSSSETSVARNQPPRS